jgi:nitrogen fixation protein NifB
MREYMESSMMVQGSIETEVSRLHPCFSHAARLTHARVHLPVASRCNMQCGYCNRKYDCVNESRPGVTCMVMSPREAVSYLDEINTKTRNFSVVGIAGPGDPFANADETIETLRLVRNRYPDILLCLATNGLNLLPYVAVLAKLGVSHVSITINAVDPEIGAKIYSWISYGNRRLEGIEAAALLWERQKLSIPALRSHGMVIKVNSILIPGINDQHIPEVAENVSGLGANLFNVMPIYPVLETPFASIAEPGPGLIAKVRSRAGGYLPQMTHCTRCRADAVGLLGEPGCAGALQDFRKKTDEATTAKL